MSTYHYFFILIRISSVIFSPFKKISISFLFFEMFIFVLSCSMNIRGGSIFVTSFCRVSAKYFPQINAIIRATEITNDCVSFFIGAYERGGHLRGGEQSSSVLRHQERV